MFASTIRDVKIYIIIICIVRISFIINYNIISTYTAKINYILFNFINRYDRNSESRVLNTNFLIIIKSVTNNKENIVAFSINKIK